MKIQSLELKIDGISKKFDFGNKTLIFSEKNSVGKSTLLRLLFYSMGYSIPSTKGLIFSKVETCLTITNHPKEITSIIRSDKKINIFFKEKKIQEHYMPYDEDILLSLLWGTENKHVFNSIIGSIYMDQEKGWTLLNRGIVIGKIRFHIRTLLAGLANKDISELEEKLNSINLEINKYSKILNIVEYKDNLIKNNENLMFTQNYSDELEKRINLLKINELDLKRDIKELEGAMRDNKNFINYIEKMDLEVKDIETGILIPVNEKTILNFNNNQHLISARLSRLKLMKSENLKELNLLKMQQRESESLFNLQDELSRIDDLITKINLPYENINKTLLHLKQQKRNYEKMITEKVSHNNESLISIYNNVVKYAEILDVDKYIDYKKDFIFTNDLKSLSGAVLHKIIFSFKMAYILELQKFLGFLLPIVLDSPSGRELDQQNIQDTFSIINKDFKHNQIIIASIYEPDNFYPDKKIELVKKIFID